MTRVHTKQTMRARWREAGQRWGRQYLLVAGLSGVVGGLLGCHDLTNQPLPSGTVDPASFQTPVGALGMRNAAIVALQQALPSYLVDEGLLTDELESNLTGVSLGLRQGTPGAPQGSLDARLLPEFLSGTGTNADNDYGNLQRARGSLTQALGALAAYDTLRADAASVKVQRGELYALQAYVDIMLADFFCSGVPLSTLDFQQDFTYHAGSTTAQVYQAAHAAADSAVALAGANDTVVNLARVLQGRALLALDSAAAAAQAVAAVPDGFQYRLSLVWNATGDSTQNVLFTSGATVADSEGQNGIAYVSGRDPRVATIAVEVAVNNQNDLFGFVNLPLHFPARYNIVGIGPFPVATGIEARLIQAEAALHAGDATWLTTLTHLRTDGTFTVAGTDTSWNAGTGGVAGLRPVTDPGTGGSDPDSARVSLLFRERALWLFLSGHRQGDLRRLIRQYGRRQDQVYPTGVYLAPGAGLYGTDVTAPIPAAEYTNPLFQGCVDRDG